MTDLGDTIRLSASNVDGSGAPADSGVVPVLTVTLPDASTSTPAIVHDGTGLWHADFVTTQSGRHTARWVGTGANAFAFADAFQVDPADPGALFSLAEGKRVLGGATAVPASKDDQLRDMITAVTPVIEDLVGPIVARALDEWHDGGWHTIALDYRPVLSVTSITESYGAGTTRTLTEQILDAGGSFDAYGYTIDKNTGMIERRAVGVSAMFAGGRRNIHIIYKAGRAVLSSNVRLAAEEQLRFLWQMGQQGNRPGWGDAADDVEFTPSGFAVPKRVIELCADSLRPNAVG